MCVVCVHIRIFIFCSRLPWVKRVPWPFVTKLLATIIKCDCDTLDCGKFFLETSLRTAHSEGYPASMIVGTKNMAEKRDLTPSMLVHLAGKEVAQWKKKEIYSLFAGNKRMIPLQANRRFVSSLKSPTKN